MRRAISYFGLLIVLLSSLFVTAYSIPVSADNECPNQTVYLALSDHVRGYPFKASGGVDACQDITGPNTTLQTARTLVISKHADLHVLQFLTNGTFSVFAPDATGNATPTRTVEVFTNDLVAIAVDSHVNDYVLSVRDGPQVAVFPNTANGRSNSNPVIITDPNIGLVGSIAIDKNDHLLIAGYNGKGEAQIDTLAISKNAPPVVLTSLHGPKTGMLPYDQSFVGIGNISIALNPQTGELFVFTASTVHSQTEVSVFAPNANGDASPLRVISGDKTKIQGVGFLGTNKIAVSANGTLVVSEPSAMILVFAPGANGNVQPSRILFDKNPPSSSEGGIAVRG